MAFLHCFRVVFFVRDPKVVALVRLCDLRADSAARHSSMKRNYSKWETGFGLALRLLRRSVFESEDLAKIQVAEPSMELFNVLVVANSRLRNLRRIGG